jgi:hypothetical protein
MTGDDIFINYQISTREVDHSIVSANILGVEALKVEGRASAVGDCLSK